jgi:hypothetical protein
LEVHSLVYLLTKVLKTFCLFYTIGVLPDKTNLVQSKCKTTAKMAEMQQALQMATTNVQLAILPTFSNNL